MRIRPTLALKFSLAFLVLIFLITSLSLWITTTGIESGLLEADQRESAPIVQELAKQLTDHISPTLNIDAIFALFHRFSNTNPRLIPFLIKRNGEIIVSSVDKSFIKSNQFNTRDIL